MKTYVLLWLILAVTTYQAAAQGGPAGASNTIAQGASITSSQTDTNPPTIQHLGIPDADWESHQQWRETAEYAVMVAEIRLINQEAEPRGYLTSNEVERLIFYMQSPHHAARDLAVITAQIGRTDPARAILIPHVLTLLSDPVGVVRQAAAHTLGEIGDNDMIAYLKPLLNDPVAGTQAKLATKKLQQRSPAPVKSGLGIGIRSHYQTIGL